MSSEQDEKQPEPNQRSKVNEIIEALESPAFKQTRDQILEQQDRSSFRLTLGLVITLMLGIGTWFISWYLDSQQQKNTLLMQQQHTEFALQTEAIVNKLQRYQAINKAISGIRTILEYKIHIDQICRAEADEEAPIKLQGNLSDLVAELVTANSGTQIDFSDEVHTEIIEYTLFASRFILGICEFSDKDKKEMIDRYWRITKNLESIIESSDKIRKNLSTKHYSVQNTASINDAV